MRGPLRAGPEVHASSMSSRAPNPMQSTRRHAETTYRIVPPAFHGNWLRKVSVPRPDDWGSAMTNPRVRLFDRRRGRLEAVRMEIRGNRTDV